MQQQIDYIKEDKVYRTKKKSTWRPRRARLWLLCFLVPLMVLGVYAGISSVSIERTGLTEYTVTGEVDYQVYLKDNDYYSEKYLGKDMTYIADLINIVRTDFRYELETEENLDTHYTYEIVATARATEKNNQKKILYEKTATLESGTAEMRQGEVSINESVDIDYDQYNNLMRTFRQDFGLSASCFLDLRLIVKVDGAIQTEDSLAVNIPLTDQTLDIAIDTQTINREGTVGTEQTSLRVRNMPLLVVGIVILVTSLILTIVVIYMYVTRYNGNLYEKALHKLLKEYDTYIVNATENIYELPAVMRVEGFKELLDAAQAEGAPIVFLEVIPGEKAYFVVNGVNTTYRYTLSRAYQDKLAANGEKEY